MVCGLACLSPAGGRLEDILRQQCGALGEFLDVPLAPGGGGPAIGLIGFVRSQGFHFQVAEVGGKVEPETWGVLRVEIVFGRGWIYY